MAISAACTASYLPWYFAARASCAPPVSFAPFDAKTRRTEAVVEQNGKRLRVMKGAVRTIAQVCGPELPAIKALEDRVGEAACKGYRHWRSRAAPKTALLFWSAW